MNGGTFTPGSEKVRPGIYFNFKLRANERVTVGERGRVALPVVLNWGEPKKLIEISNERDASQKLGVDMTDESMFLVRETKKKAGTVLVYRVNEGVKATATLDVADLSTITVTAKYGGSKGNDITIRVSENVVDATKMDVVTFLDNQEVDRQTVADASELVANNYVTFSGSGVLVATAGTNLVGGEDGTAAATDYTDFFAAAETENFDVIGLPVDDDAIKTTFVSFVKRIREDQGVKIVGVVAGHGAGYEGIINVTNGVVLENGKTLTVPETVAWVAGASAGATLNQSLTFMDYEGATDVIPKYDHDETVDRLQKGEFLFTYDSRGKTVSVEQDINSLVGTSKMSKNKIIRILDAVNNDVVRSLKQAIKNRKNTGEDIPANADGASIVKTAISVYLNELQGNNVIQNFDPAEDLIVEVTTTGDGFNITLGVQPVDSAEKFYIDVEVL
ncbi:phage tail sheath family protein [Oceanobacillus sp. CF4.6]|uniref:phage tail sheath family protein n=1 Tax=Oceanobacillus sp. CF4.6 TaxID=3373080 RepID=UPI003EE774FC